MWVSRMFGVGGSSLPKARSEIDPQGNPTKECHPQLETGAGVV